MTCRENCIHYAVCYKKPDHFDDLEVNGGCSDFQDKGEMEITREFIVDNGLEFELFSYYERKRKKNQGQNIGTEQKGEKIKMKKDYTVTTSENLRILCIRNNWFTCGRCEQHEN